MYISQATVYNERTLYILAARRRLIPGRPDYTMGAQGLPACGLIVATALQTFAPRGVVCNRLSYMQLYTSSCIFVCTFADESALVELHHSLDILGRATDRLSGKSAKLVDVELESALCETKLVINTEMCKNHSIRDM